MGEVKRYDISAFGGMSMDERSDGAYVDYEDYAELEAKLAALVAENAAFKDINAWCKTDAFSNMYREFKTAEAVGCCSIDCMHDAMVVAIMHAPEAQATDAFLAEVRAQGVDAAIEHLINKFQSTGHIGVPVMALEHFADQLRKGSNQ